MCVVFVRFVQVFCVGARACKYPSVCVLLCLSLIAFDYPQLSTEGFRHSQSELASPTFQDVVAHLVVDGKRLVSRFGPILAFCPKNSSVYNMIDMNAAATCCQANRWWE